MNPRRSAIIWTYVVSTVVNGLILGIVFLIVDDLRKRILMKMKRSSEKARTC